MVSLNRQRHIVTRYGKSRNITLHGCSAIEPSASRHESTLFTVDPATRDNIESELEAGAFLLVSTSKKKGTSLRRPERSVTRSVNLCAGADVSEGSSEARCLFFEALTRRIVPASSSLSILSRAAGSTVKSVDSRHEAEGSMLSSRAVLYS